MYVLIDIYLHNELQLMLVIMMPSMIFFQLSAASLFVAMSTSHCLLWSKSINKKQLQKYLGSYRWAFDSSDENTYYTYIVLICVFAWQAMHRDVETLNLQRLDVYLSFLPNFGTDLVYFSGCWLTGQFHIFIHFLGCLE